MRTPVLVLAAALAVPASAMDLSTALRAALAADPTLASAAANRDAALENIAIARARLLPQVTYQNSIQHIDQTTNQAGVVREFSGPARNAQLSVRQAVYRPRERAGLEVGKQQAEYGERKLISAQTDLWNRVSAAWIDVLSAQALRDIHAATQRSIEVSAEQERKRFAAGDGTRDAMAEAEAQLALARSQFAEAKLDLQAKRQALSLLTRESAQTVDGFALPPVSGIEMVPEARDALFERVMATNPELAAARASKAIAEQRLAQASADHLPTLDVIGSMTDARNDTTNTLGLRYRNTLVGVQFVLPIYAGGGINAAQRQAVAAHQAATADIDVMTQRLSIQFEIGWSAQAGLAERAVATQELVRAAREQRRAYEFGIRAGTRTWADLGAADLLIARRESDLVNASATLLKTQAQLLALLPSSDPAWERWSTQLSSAAKR